MKKYLVLIVCLLISTVFLSACNIRTQSPIKYKRKLEKYFPSENSTSSSSTGMVDLSEGPRLNYDAKFGPRDLNFDIKIINPY